MWVTIDGDVYDLSAFGELHPGGLAPLRAAAGGDATEDFFSLHRQEVLARPRYAKLRVGRLRGHGSRAEAGAAAVAAVPVPYAEPTWLRRFSPYYKPSHERFRAYLRAFIDREIRPAVWGRALLAHTPSPPCRNGHS